MGFRAGPYVLQQWMLALENKCWPEKVFSKMIGATWGSF